MRNVYKSKRIELYVFSPADETSREGIQDTNTMKSTNSWAGMPSQSAQGTVGKGLSKLHTDRDAYKGSDDIPEWERFGWNDIEIQEWSLYKTLSDLEG